MGWFMKWWNMSFVNSWGVKGWELDQHLAGQFIVMGPRAGGRAGGGGGRAGGRAEGRAGAGKKGRGVRGPALPCPAPCTAPCPAPRNRVLLQPSSATVMPYSRVSIPLLTNPAPPRDSGKFMRLIQWS